MVKIVDTGDVRMLPEDILEEIQNLLEEIRNLRGDGDLDRQNGMIEVDYSMPSHPVIRFRTDRLRQSKANSAEVDDVSIELVGGEDKKNLQLKDFDEPSPTELPGGTLLDLLGLPVAGPDSEAWESSSSRSAYSFLSKRTETDLESPDGSTNSLDYVPKGGTVNMRPFALNGVRLCKVVADGDDTDVEIVVPSLAPVPNSGITIDVAEDSNGYPVIMIGYTGGSGGGSSWTGYYTTGSSPDVMLCALRYAANELQGMFCDEVWDNGLLVSRHFHDNWSTITTAVPESVCRCSSDPSGTEQEESDQS